MTKVCLATVLHNEPLHDLVERHFPSIALNYHNVVIEVTKETDKGILEYFDLLYPGIYYVGSGTLGQVRRRVLKTALDTDCDMVHFVDFDRLLFWQMNFPGELEQVVRTLDPEMFTVFGRTQAAMDSHPELQQLTELACNHIFADRFGYYVDILAASRGIPRSIGNKIIEQSREDNPAACDAEWCFIASNLKEVKVNGLGYESSLLGIEKDWHKEVWTRVENLRALSEYLNGDHYGRL